MASLKVLAMLLSILTVYLLNTEATKTTRELKIHWNESPRQLNILMLTVLASGHTSIPLALGEELVARGHHVTLCMTGSKYQAAAESVGISFKSSGPAHSFTQYGQKLQTYGGFSAELETFQGIHHGIGIETENYFKMFGEGQLEKNWDIVIATNFLTTLLPCLSEFLHIPVLLLYSSSQIFPHTYPPWPWPGTGINTHTDNLTFKQRLAYALQQVFFPFALAYVFNPTNRTRFQEFCPTQANTNLVTASSVSIPDIVPTVIGVEYSRTISPLSQYVGPILTNNPKPITGKLEQWLNSKENKSIVYISMGSVTLVTNELARAFIEGVKKTNYSVLWAMRRTDDFEIDIDMEPGRFYTEEWLPQLSVLKHRAVAMTIMHGGSNGIHESLANGVPLIVVPGMQEQISTAGKIHGHKLGLHLDKEGLTADQVYESITKIEAGDYRENVRQLQKIFRAAGGVKRAGDLVEFYSEVGYDHLIPAYAKYHWSWVQYYNVDVYILLLSILLLTIYFWYRVTKCVCSRYCCTKKLKND